MKFRALNNSGEADFKALSQNKESFTFFKYGLVGNKTCASVCQATALIQLAFTRALKTEEDARKIHPLPLNKYTVTGNFRTWPLKDGKWWPEPNVCAVYAFERTWKKFETPQCCRRSSQAALIPTQRASHTDKTIKLASTSCTIKVFKHRIPTILRITLIPKHILSITTRLAKQEDIKSIKHSLISEFKMFSNHFG